MTMNETIKKLEENCIEYTINDAWWNDTQQVIRVHIDSEDTQIKKLIKKLGFKCEYSHKGYLSTYSIIFAK